jgi:hypothetical protein
MDTLLRTIFGFVLWLFCISSCFAGEDGLLIIYVDLVSLNNQGGATDRIDWISSYSLLNLNTRRSYQFSVWTSARVDAEEVEEGIYCLASASFANTEIKYCGEPYFKVVAGKVNNAGWWRLGYSFYDRSSKLIFSAKNPDEVLARAKTSFKDPLKKYGMEASP